MNFYIADDDPDTIALLSDLIENDFNNSIVLGEISSFLYSSKCIMALDE